MRLRYAIAVVVVLMGACTAEAARDLTVALDGSGDFRTVQAAVDSVPLGNRERVVIYVRNGTYREQIRIHSSFLTLRGEDRKRTRIEAEVNTSACVTTPEQSKEEQCATLIADGSDLVFENLTMENPHEGEHDKGAALSVVGKATHVVIANVDVIGHGGDTLTLSARRWDIGAGAEYYLNDVYVSGTYHIIVPRGTTYVVNSKFWCLGGEKNCLFNEGITRETDKLVIRNSTIDGPEPFGLGSYFRDATWYFVEDTFSSKLLPDGQIRREPAKNYELKWGEGRVYFADNQTPGYAWLKDNLDQSPAKNKSNVTAVWTLPDWNPESKSGPRVVELKEEGDKTRLVFSESVTVRGRPEIKLRSGGKAVYSGGSGSNTLEFTSRERSRAVSVDLNGGSIFASAASVHAREAELEFKPTK